jgi:hypothetical protein
LSHLYIKCIILPRQARDKHRENSKNGRFLQAPLPPPLLRAGTLGEAFCIQNTQQPSFPHFLCSK